MKRNLFSLVLLSLGILLTSCGKSYQVEVKRVFNANDLSQISINHYSQDNNQYEDITVTDSDDIAYVYSKFSVEYTDGVERKSFSTDKSSCIEIYDVNFSFKATERAEYNIKYYVYSHVDGAVLYPDNSAYSFYGNAKYSTFEMIKSYLEQKSPYLYSLFPWIYGINKSDVDYMISGSTLGTISPTFSSFNSWYINSSESQIETAISTLRNTRVKKTDDPMWAGVGNQILTIFLKDGTSKTLSSCANGFTFDGQYYELQTSLPSFSKIYGRQFLPQAISDFKLYKGEEELTY